MNMPGRRLSLIWPSDPTINAPARYKRACAYEAWVPDPIAGREIRLSGSAAGVAADAEAAIREVNAVAGPALAPLARLLLRTESIASSRVEGLHVGARELARAEARAETGGRVGATAREVIANVGAMELAVRDAARAESFGVDHVLSIHRRLMEAGSPRIAGRLRTVQNWIGGNEHTPCGADFVPPPPEHVPALLQDLCAAIADVSLPAVVQAAMVHAQFETIHPFDDGNGRTGRALIHVVLRRRGVAMHYVPPVSVVLAGARDRYVAGLTAYREDRLDDWIEHFASAAARSAALARAYLAAVKQLSLFWCARLGVARRAPRADAAAWAVIDVLPAHPVLTAPAAIAATGRSGPQVYAAIKQLESAGVLVPLSQKLRNQSWEPVGLLELLEAMEAGELPPPAVG
jgi:Fic family protein